MSKRPVNRNSQMYDAIKHIMSALFKKEDSRLVKWLDDIHEANVTAHETGLDGFIYEGKFYRPSYAARGGVKRKALHPSLHQKMNHYVKDDAIIKQDKQRISQILYIMLQPSTSLQEFHDTLPDCLDDITKGLGGIETRVYDEACTIKTNEKAMKAYAEVLPKIITYATARLLY